MKTLVAFRSNCSILIFILACQLGVQFAHGVSPWTLRGEFQTRGEVWSSPAIGPDDTVYVGSTDGNLYALGFTSSGEFIKKWSYSTGGQVYSSPALGSDGSIF